MILIRTATKEDLPQILAIEQEAFSSPWSLEAFHNEMQFEYAIFEVAVIEKAVVAYYILRLLSGGDAEIINIAVRKSYRRRGVADRLMQSIMSYAATNKLQSIYLEVRQSNEPAILLYKKYGFFELGIRKNYYTEPFEDALTMGYNRFITG